MKSPGPWTDLGDVGASCCLPLQSDALCRCNEVADFGPRHLITTIHNLAITENSDGTHPIQPLPSITAISELPEAIMVDERVPRESLDRDVKTDRRRPGRLEYPNAALIRMMRGTYDATIHELHRIEDDKADAPDVERASKSRAPDRDDLRVARGVVISAAFWLVIGSAIWVLLRIV